jgi:hypothetical protein
MLLPGRHRSAVDRGPHLRHAYGFAIQGLIRLTFPNWLSTLRPEAFRPSPAQQWALACRARSSRLAK